MGEILFFLMLILPLGLFPSLEYVTWSWQQLIPVLYGLFWTWDFQKISLNTHWLNAEFLTYVFPTIVFDIILILAVIGFYEGIISSRNTILIGISSTLVPLSTSIVTNSLFMQNGAYVGPLPFMFLFSLILLYKVPGPEHVIREALEKSHDATNKISNDPKDED